jgi:hypothetical protein
MQGAEGRDWSQWMAWDMQQHSRWLEAENATLGKWLNQWLVALLTAG